MVATARLLYTAVLLASGGATVALTAFAYRHRKVPGAKPFALLMLTLAHWSLWYAVGLQITGSRFWRLVVLRVQWLAHPMPPLFILLFALAYTGNDDVLDRRTVGALAAIPVVVVLAAWTNQWHHLLWTAQEVVVVDGMATLIPTYGPLFWINIVYGYGIEIVGVALLLRLIYQSEYLYTDQSAFLAVGILTPFVANVVEVFMLGGQASVDLTPVTFAVSGLAFGYALFRRQLFDLIPATRKIGRDAAIRQLDTGVVIVDTDRRVVYCNAAAADVFGCQPTAALGREVGALVDAETIDFDADGALAELERGDAVYEVRTSPIADRNDRLIGHTLIVHDVTARKERERELANQRDELATLNELNAVIRGVNQALVSAGSREAIERTVCDRVADSELYRTVCIGDVATWTGDADRWTVASSAAGEPTPPALDDDGLRPAENAADGGTGPLVATAADGGDWTVVPITYGRTVYGALGLHTVRESVSEREREILAELGETIGHAVNAVETRQLLSAESVVELEIACGDEADPLVAVASDLSCEVELEGIVPGGAEGPVAYLQVAGADPEAAREALAADGGESRVVRTAGDANGGLLEWQVTGGAPLGAIFDRGANVHRAAAADGRASYELDIAAAADVRALVDHLRERFDDVRLLSKRERSQGVEAADALPDAPLEDLTDRQREVLEAAYRAGYFEWPRDSNAEEVAETLDISSATLHSHLRKAERSLLVDLFEVSNGDPSGEANSES
ncbi:histidine kinase N-terminal 7TM domain-containing protein [Halosimplex marinum]|uniref:histidine kinase N-terminal 7TM domain-containing protein n=1 Tax=Halosimplex marinum TaxID=3396620 RepID=UPI003F566328